MVRLCGYAPKVGQGHTQSEVRLPHRPAQRTRTPQTMGKGRKGEETQKGNGRRETFSRTQIKILRYLIHGWHNPSPRFGERAGILEEGVAMHHCVFSNRYYLREDSLILSATIEGRWIETIEVNLETLKVVQSRGVCNQNTEYHDQIVNLVNANKRLIRQRMRQTA